MTDFDYKFIHYIKKTFLEESYQYHFVFFSALYIIILINLSALQKYFYLPRGLIQSILSIISH